MPTKKSKKNPAGVRFGPESLERIDPPESAKSPAAGAPSAASKPLLRLPRCPLCRQRPATEKIELGLVHVRTCAPCAANAHTAMRVFGVLKAFF
jgi:hypothetical protein